MAKPGQSARKAALTLIEGVVLRRQTLGDQMAAGALADLPPEDRARAGRLAGAVLRNLGRADAVLKPHLRKSPPATVRAILQLGTVEMLAEGAAPHAVVNACVDLVRQGGTKAETFAGLANAVLRRVSETPPGEWEALPPQQLPGWLRGRLMAAYGKVNVMAMEAAHARGAPVDLTPKDSDAAALADRVSGVALPTGSVRLAGHVHVSDLPGFATGDWWVQDAAAALAARVLRARPGERVLDLCAAPGGKTLQLAAAGADVTALDVSADRMARLAENLSRCSLAAATVVADVMEWQAEAPFDAVLLDAPCSATGTIRRHPDLPLVRDAEGLKPIFAVQARMIDRAVALVRPGGRIVYCTCSLLPEEGERQVSAALARHPDLRVEPGDLTLPGVDPTWVTPEGGLRLRPDYWPNMGGMDGFYIVSLRFGG
jgi:16S rRNA (cytosine967-C5)-methyltransferase